VTRKALAAGLAAAAFTAAGLGLAMGQGATAPVTTKPAAPASAVPDAATAPADTTPQPVIPKGPMILYLRGLDKITGKPTNITAQVGKPVTFFTLTITARYCYSTPPSETPETSAFLQIDDHRPDQEQRRVFSGWMYASSPGLNGMEHPLYDVWVIGCNTNTPTGAAPSTVASTAPVKVAAPDSSDKEGVAALPAEAGQ
jgi:hypothetical protein